MKHKYYFSILLSVACMLISMNAIAQTEDKVFIVEALVCDSTGAAIKDIAVYDSQDNIRSVTDRDGIARIATRIGETLYFSHLSFKKKAVRIDKKTLIEGEDGHFSMLVIMQRKTNTLTEVTVTENAPHLAYANKKVWVIDYKVQHDGIYMVAGNGDESVLLHLGLEQDTISRKPVTPKYQELYRDAFNNLHLIGPDSTYQIYCDGKQLHLLYGTKKDLFRQKLEPIKIVTDSIMVLQNYANMQQQLIYLMINRNTKQISILSNIDGTTSEMARNVNRDAKKDKKIDMLVSEFTDYPQSEEGNTPTGAKIKQSMETNNNSDGNDVIERKLMMKNLYNLILFKPIYCPAFYIGDTIYIFDFENDKLLKYDNRGSQVDSCEIVFHRTGYFKELLVNKSWDKKLIVDEAANQCYAQFTTDGIVTLKEVNLIDGGVMREIQLTKHTFPQNIQVYNGEVYYLFLNNNTQTAGRDRRSLNKMRLE